MEFTEIKALGRILRILTLAIQETDHDLTDAEFKGYVSTPTKYLGPLIIKAQNLGALTKKWDRQIETQMQFVNLSTFDSSHILSNEDQGVLLIAYWGYDPEQMSISEAAEFARVSENSIREAVKAGKIKGYKLGNKYYLFKKSIEFYKDNKRG